MGRIAAPGSARPAPLTPGGYLLNMQEQGITVTGRGEVQVVPDIAMLNIGVQASARSVAEARDRAAGAASKLIANIKSQNVADADIRTSQLSVGPRYDYSHDGGQKLLGYDVSNIVHVVVRDVAKLGGVVDGALEAGGDAVMLNGLQFSVSDPRAAEEEARRLAIGDAAAKAAQLASHAGVSLGLPVAITEGQPAGPQPMLHAMAMKMESQQATPIEAGTTAVTCDVTVTYAIAPGS